MRDALSIARSASGTASPAHVLITGAGSGIGAALARRYAAAGTRLSLTARDPVKLQLVAADCRGAGAETDIYAGDVADGPALAEWIGGCDARRPVDMAIANAGVGGARVIAGDAGETLAVAREVIATNILGVANTVIPLLPRFVSRGRGHVVLMSSLAAYLGHPAAPLYSASKAAVRVYGDGLRRLLAPKGIRVTVICPGFVETPMSATVPGRRPLLWSAERAAERISRGLARGEREIAFPWALVALTRLAAILPPPLIDPLLYRSRPRS